VFRRCTRITTPLWKADWKTWAWISSKKWRRKKGPLLYTSVRRLFRKFPLFCVVVLFRISGIFLIISVIVNGYRYLTMHGFPFLIIISVIMIALGAVLWALRSSFLKKKIADFLPSFVSSVIFSILCQKQFWEELLNDDDDVICGLRFMHFFLWMLNWWLCHSYLWWIRNKFDSLFLYISFAGHFSLVALFRVKLKILFHHYITTCYNSCIYHNRK